MQIVLLQSDPSFDVYKVARLSDPHPLPNRERRYDFLFAVGKGMEIR